jgi:Fic family protein
MPNTRNLSITPEILRLIATIDEFKGAWRALGNIAPERLSALKHVATIESIGSSTRIEGSKLSDREVEKLLANLQIKQFASRDEQEALGYATVMDLIFESWPDIAPSENHIKQLHRDLLSHSEKDNRHRGQYKTSSNNVVAIDQNGKQIGVVFETASAFETPKLMKELMAWMDTQQTQNELHPLLAIGIWVVTFLAIHPFQDGNGRLSRILTTLFLLRAGYAFVPFSSLESVIELNKESYYLALRQTQMTIYKKSPKWMPWLLFFLRSLAEMVRRLEAKIGRETLLMANIPALSQTIIELARAHGHLTMRDATRLTGANRNTLKQHFRQLVEKKRLVQRGEGRGAWYELG